MKKKILLGIIGREGLISGKGGESKHLVNLFKLTTAPAYLRIIAQALIEIMETKPDMLASPSIESDPIVTALSLETGLPFVCIHGGNVLYGEIEKGASIDIIADVTLTGETVLSTIKTINELGKVRRVYTVVDLEKGAHEKFKKEGIDLISLIRISELDL